MSKLITAKEAFALSKYENDLNKHIERLNKQIRLAALQQATSTTCVLYCNEHTMSQLTGRLVGAGFRVCWHMIDMFCGYMEISWGES